MTETELQAILQREGAQVDWKKAGNPPNIVETLAAFANDYQQRGGGTVVCGIEEEHLPDGRIEPHIVGLPPDRLKELRDKVFEQCRRRVRPPLAPEFEDISLTAHPHLKVLVIWVPSGGQVYAYDGKYVVRIDDKTCAASEAQIRELYQRGARPWIEQPCPGASLANLDLLALRQFLGRLHAERPVEDLLRPDAYFVQGARPLVSEDPRPFGEKSAVPNRFALLLFGLEPARWIPGAIVRLSEFPGTTREASQFQTATFHGPIPRLLSDILARLQGQLTLIVDKGQDFLAGQQNRPRYSEQALREALVNALVHRDYQDGNPTVIQVFADRIEISNPGGAQRAGGLPDWRNPSLAAYMIELGLAQAQGTGLPKIESETQLVAGRPPEIDFGGFRIVLPAYRPSVPSGESSWAARRGTAALIVLSVGPGSIRDQVKASLPDLGLQSADVVVEYSFGHFVNAKEWQLCARAIRDALRPKIDDPRYLSFHLFYKGPVTLPPLIGALLRGEKPLTVYYHEPDGYHPAYTIDKKFLTEEG